MRQRFWWRQFGYWFDKGGWIRVRSLVLVVKHRDDKPLFSEREGYRRFVRVWLTPYRVRLEWQKQPAEGSLR